MKKYSINVFLLLFLYLFSSHLLASSNMSADEVRNLFTGNTVEGERREFEKPGRGFTGKLINFAEKFVSYYAEDGTVKQQIGEQQKTGKWRVTESGELCTGWEGKEEKCAPVYKEGDIYKRVTKNNKGRQLWEIRYIRFIPGNENNL
jgi:hypothetical protein